MRIAVIGTGMVGRNLAGGLEKAGHDVVIGTRDPRQTLARTEPDAMGTPAYRHWQQDHPGVRLLPFAEAGADAEVVVNASAGASALAALGAVGAQNLAGKVLLDVALPLDLSQGLPPKLLVANDDSLGEQVQRAFPEAKVVKSLTTVFTAIMVDPARVPGDHNIFVAGEDAAAKDTVRTLLRDFGWPKDAVIDLGGIKGARAVEMYTRLYFDLVGVFGDFDFNIAVVRAR